MCVLAVAGACAWQAPAAQSAPAATGPQLFERACAKCHAPDGSGGLPTVPNGPRPIDLRNPEWQKSRADAEIVATIRDGRGAMPPFADVLSGDEIAALAAHVRRLAAPAR